MQFPKRHVVILVSRIPDDGKVQKPRLSVDTMRATLVVRQNCVIECEKFYDKDRNLLRKITSSEKYSW
jgi:hypothetical protein